MSSDAECLVVEETWRTARGQPKPLVKGSLEQSNPQIEFLIKPEFGECESVDKPLTAMERNADEGIGSAEVEPMDSVSVTVVKRPVPAQRYSFTVPVEPRAPTPVPRRSQRQSAGKHSNPYNLPKSACNVVSFSSDILS